MRTWITRCVGMAALIGLATGATAVDAAEPGAALAAGRTRVELRPNRGYAFAQAGVVGQTLESLSEAVYPAFRFVSAKGESVEMACDDARVKAAAERVNPTTLAVTYTFEPDDTRVLVTWSVTPDQLTCTAALLVEGEQLRLESVGPTWKPGGVESNYGRINHLLGGKGARPFMGMTLGAEDYVVGPDSFLLRPPADGKALMYQWQALGNQSWINAVAAKLGQDVVYLKPLTYSNILHGRVIHEGGQDRAQFGAVLYFRPASFLNPKTALVHRELGWRLESAGDVNADGEVDWVDAAIAYRNRYIVANPKRPAFWRDSFMLYHQVPFGDRWTPRDSWPLMVQTLQKIDFATGQFLVKGAVATLRDQEMRNGERGPTEWHSYQVRVSDVLGDRTSYNQQLRATGHRVGMYYGGEYFAEASGDWPEPFFQYNREGKIAYIGVGRHNRTDLFRSYQAGLLKDYFARVFRTAGLLPGDPVYLDSYNCGSNFTFHPEYPTTPQSDLEVRRGLSKWFKYEQGLNVACEGVTESVADIEAFALAQSGFFAKDERTYYWTAKFPRKLVPMFPVIYTGNVYGGDRWYELRSKTPNWAAAIGLCGQLVDWDSRHYPAHVYEKAARTFFNNNIFWSKIADYRIADFDRQGDTYTIRFEEGPDGDKPRLWTDPPNGRFWLEKSGIRYDGFTPFSTRGVMAILKQGDFDLTLPIREDLEILPSQPHRERLAVTISRTKDGLVRVQGNFSQIPWQLPLLYTKGQEEVIELIDVEPVLMLRKKGVGAGQGS